MIPTWTLLAAIPMFLMTGYLFGYAKAIKNRITSSYIRNLPFTDRLELVDIQLECVLETKIASIDKKARVIAIIGEVRDKEPTKVTIDMTSVEWEE